MNNRVSAEIGYKIFKYSIETANDPRCPVDIPFVKLPINGNIIRVEYQCRELHIWVNVKPDVELKPVQVKVFGTGFLIPPEWTWIGTVESPCRDRFIQHIHVRNIPVCLIPMR